MQTYRHFNEYFIFFIIQFFSHISQCGRLLFRTSVTQTKVILSSVSGELKSPGIFNSELQIQIQEQQLSHRRRAILM